MSEAVLRLWNAVIAVALTFPVAAQTATAQVISIDDGGVSRTYCTAAQNGGVEQASTGRHAIPPMYRSIMERAGHRYEISPDFLDVVARQESNYDPRAVSPKGAIGVMQLMPATARAFGVNPYDVEENILGGAAYLRYLLNAYGGRIDLALGAYNAGQGIIARYGIPPFKETRVYLLRNFENLAQKSDSLTPVEAADSETGYIQICRR